MRTPRTSWLLTGGALLLVVLPATWLLAGNSADEEAAVTAVVHRGDFAVTVTTSGELQALHAVEITAPARAQEAGAYQMKIASIVPEGTIVKEGDPVAELDRSQMANRSQEVSLALQKAVAVNEQAMLDTTLNLSKAREEIRTLESAVEEKTLAKDQAIYEAPSIQRQAEIDLEKAKRGLEQAKQDYVTKEQQSKAKMREVGADVTRAQSRMDAVQEVMGEFSISAPAPGMVIYRKEWNGKKRAAGSQVSAWDPVVATLPDLTRMESITYVNEIDIRSLATGQPVSLTLDSDPTKVLTGTVTKVANVGEERPNTDAKVFEVRITIDQSDTTLRPGMTTGNVIQTLKVPDVLSVPLEAVNTEDGVPFVYLRRGGGVTKQEVVTGAINEDAVIVERGLEENDVVLLSPPADGDAMTLVRLPDSPANQPAAGGDTALGADTMPAPAPPAPPPGPTGTAVTPARP